MNTDPDYYSYLSLPVDEINGIYIRYFYHGFPPRIRIVLEINDKTTRDKIKNAWPQILKHRSDILEIQGNDLTIKYDVVVYELQKFHQQGLGYRRIAKFLNYHSIALLCCLNNDIEENKFPDEQASLGYLGFYTLCKGLRLWEEEFNSWFARGVSNVKKRTAPWSLEGGPFKYTRVREHIRYFKERLENGTIKIGPHFTENDAFEFERVYLFLHGWYKTANNLLERNNKTQWKNNEDWIIATLNEISIIAETSNKPIIQDLRKRLS